MGTGFAALVGNNNTTLKIDLSSGGSDPDAFYVENHALTHEALPGLYLLAGIGKAFGHRTYSGAEVYLKYNPHETNGKLKLLESGNNALNHMIDNTVLIASRGFTYGINYVQSIFFSKPFFIYSLIGMERSTFRLSTITEYASSGSDFGNVKLQNTFRRYGLNIGGITRSIADGLSLRAEYVYTQYRNLEHSGAGIIQGAQAGDTVTAHSTVNPKNATVRLLLTCTL